ncbi:MAG: DinB family protein [Candidatus Hodarchaeales archaeon]|jgi:uncharacterized damage-inducible protein DinB
MSYELIFQSAIRHFEETQLIIDQLSDNLIKKEPVISGRSLGEIVLHIIRSLEYYTQGLAKNIWKPLPYSLDDYSSAQSLKELYSGVVTKVLDYLEIIREQNLETVLIHGNRSATRIELLTEMLEHSIQHRGQLLVYYRLLGLEPAKIPYII